VGKPTFDFRPHAHFVFVHDQVGKGVGIVKFVGKHADTGSDRLGIELNKPLGFHNGTVQGHTYFTCPSNCGVLVVPLKAELMIRGADFRDHKSEAGAKLARRRDVIEVGDRVLVPNKGEGFVRYFGPSDLTAADAVRVEGRRPSLVQQELRILHTLAGVELDEPLGKHNGTTEGFAYFKCADLHGYMVLPDKLTLIKKAIDWEDEHRAQVLAKAMGVGKGLDASDGDRVVKNAQAEASSRAAKAQDRKAKDEAKKAAKETAKQAEADRKAADKARKQKEKDDKRAAVKAERERKMREAAATCVHLLAGLPPAPTSRVCHLQRCKPPAPPQATRAPVPKRVPKCVRKPPGATGLPPWAWRTLVAHAHAHAHAHVHAFECAACSCGSDAVRMPCVVRCIRLCVCVCHVATAARKAGSTIGSARRGRPWSSR